MGQDPDLIRREIEETRERMGETVDALGYKADVKSRAKESVTGKVDSLKEKVVGAKDSAMESAPSTGEMQHNAKRAVGIAQENPLGLAIGSLAVGFLAGMLIPSTRVEDQKLGRMADQVKSQIKETGQEALHRGMDVASSAADAAKQTAQEQGREHASALQESAQQSAQDVRRQVTS
jgi:gas vesicle protein